MTLKKILISFLHVSKKRIPRTGLYIYIQSNIHFIVCVGFPITAMDDGYAIRGHYKFKVLAFHGVRRSEI